MKIALIGATGFIGSALLSEALQRGHSVTAVVNNLARLPQHANLTGVAADVNARAALADKLRGHDLVITAFSGHAQGDNVLAYYEAGFRNILGAVKDAGVARFLVVGGAGSLKTPAGTDVVDSPDFPSQWKGTAEGARRALHILRDEPTLNWTMLSPAAHIAPGPRTGTFRLGKDHLLLDAKGESHISLADYAVAMLDEAEVPQHPRQRFTLAY